MHEAIAGRREELAAVCREYGVRRLEIFGSAARRDDFDEEASDADFLVEFDGDGGRSPLGQFFGFAKAVETVLGRRVDLVEGERYRTPSFWPASNRRASSFMRRDIRAFLRDIQEAADAIERFVAGLDDHDYSASDVVRSAVERKFEIIGSFRSNR